MWHKDSKGDADEKETLARSGISDHEDCAG